ncbi:hypothetical protein EG329_008514 [Mollisiaceae sp. DMI_Dod_QoI]|nr:hypothetical protein EG329_008514 [Helotiales sp. DMI_Dod_QoI]
MEGTSAGTGVVVPDDILHIDKTESTTEAKEEPVLPSSSSTGVLPLITLSPSILSELNTKLLSAAQKGNLTEVESLLGQGAEINTKDHPDGRTALHLAARNDRPKVVEALLRHNLDVNIQDACSGLTPLAIAATHGFESVLNALLGHHSVDLNTTDKGNRRTALHLAARGNKKAIVEALSKQGGAEVSPEDKWGYTPLHLAAREGYDSIVQDLLRKRANVNAKDEDENSPLHLAARGGHSTTVKILLDPQLLLDQELEFDLRNKAGETPLHCASKKVAKGDVEVNSVVTSLLERGADINAKDTENEETPLHIAARNGSQGAVEALLNFNNPVAVTGSVPGHLKSNRPTADVNLENKNKYTPLSIAIRHGWDRIVRLMLERATPSADLSCRGPMENITSTVTIFENALRKGNENIVLLFLDPSRSTFKEIDTPWDSDLRCTPLSWAVKEGKQDLTSTLLKSGARIDLPDKDGISPLQMASRCGHERITEDLLNHDPKPEVDLKGEDDWTALHFASFAGNDKIVRLLLERQADPCARTRRTETNNGDTPLSLAASKFHTKSIEVLLSWLRDRLHHSPEPDAQELAVRCLGLDKNGRGARYRYNAMKSAAEHEETHDLVKFVLKARDFLDPHAFRWDSSDNESSMESNSAFWDEKIRDFRCQIDDRVRPKDGKEEHSWDALQWAVYRGEIDLVERLLVSSNSEDKKVQKKVQKKRESAEDLASKICEEIHKKRDDADVDANQTHEGWMLSSIMPSEYSSAATDDELEQGGGTAKDSQDMGFSGGQGVARSRRQSTTSVPSIKEEERGLPITNKDDFLDKLNMMEEDYLNIRDSLRYGIPLNPGVVKIADMNKSLVAPSLNMDKESKAKIDDFFAGIIDIYNDGDGVAFLRRSRRVEKVIYDMGPKAIMESARAPVKKSQITLGEAQVGEAQETDRKEEDLRLRWVHLPANNITWMEDLTLRLLLDKKPDNTAILERPDSYWDSQDFLRQSWHELPKGNSQVHFMKPTCVKQNTKPRSGNTDRTGVKRKQESKSNSDSPNERQKETKETKGTRLATEKDKSKVEDTLKGGKMTEQKEQAGIPNALALYMPYFTFSTLTEKKFDPSLARQMEERSIRARESSMLGGLKDALPLRSRYYRTVHDRTHPSISTVRGNEPELKVDEARQINSHEGFIKRITRRLRQIIQAAHPKIEAPRISSEPSCPETQPQLSIIAEAETYQNLFEAYKHMGSIIHGSRTLDEFFYHSLSDKDAQADLEIRNKDQVTTKRIRHVISHVGGPGYWTIIRVDQLWLWIVDNKTIISSSTHRLDKTIDPILEGIWKYMNSDEVQTGRASLPSSPYEMAKFITEFCIEFFDHATCTVGVVEESMHEIYKNAINQRTRDEALLFDTFAKKVNGIISSLGPAKPQADADLEVQAEEQVKENFHSIKDASALLKEIKDIRDELNMLKAVLTQQKSVWNELHDPQTEKDNLRGPAYAINNIVEMDKQAERVQDAVLSVLGLEQNEASIQEAMSSREQAQESIRQGRTLMVFTIVTIFFLPGSFLASLFALNIAVFPRAGGDSVYWPNWAFAVIFGLTIALSILIIGFAFYVDNVKKLVKRYRERKLSHDNPKTEKPQTKSDTISDGTLLSKRLLTNSNSKTTKPSQGLIGLDLTNSSRIGQQSSYSLFKRSKSMDNISVV